MMQHDTVVVTLTPDRQEGSYPNKKVSVENI